MLSPSAVVYRGWKRGTAAQGRRFLPTCLSTFIRKENILFSILTPSTLNLEVLLAQLGSTWPLLSWRKVENTSLWLFKPFYRMWAMEMGIKHDSWEAREGVRHNQVKLKKNFYWLFIYSFVGSFGSFILWDTWFFFVDSILSFCVLYFICSMTLFCIWWFLKISILYCQIHLFLEFILFYA